MFTITIVAVGKLKEPFYRDACAEYAKRLPAYCRLDRAGRTPAAGRPVSRANRRRTRQGGRRHPREDSKGGVGLRFDTGGKNPLVRSAGRAAADGQDRRGVVSLFYPGQLLRAGPGG